MAVKATNQKEFSLDLRKFMKKVDIDILLVIKKVVLEVHNGVVMKTPVLTGAARASWRISINSPAKGYHQGDTISPNAAQSVAQAAQGIIVKIKPTDLIHITNNIPYAVRLEYGWSNQAPHGMVRLTLAEVSNSL